MTIIAGDSEKRVPKAFGFLMKKPVLSQEFAKLEGSAWKAFVKQQAKRLGVSMTADAADLLAQAYAGNTWGLITELQKLAHSGKKVVAADDITGLHPEAAQDFWKTLMGLRANNRQARLATLEKILAGREAPAKVFNILAASWKEKTASFARFDLLVKSGKLDYEEALLDLVIS